MRQLHLIPVPLCFALLLLGCGDDPAGKEPGQCGFAAGAGAATVTAGAAKTLDTLDDKAQNNSSHETKAQLGAPGLSPLAHAPDGTAGLLLWTKGASGTQLGFVDPKKGGIPEVIVAKVASSSSRNAALFFNADSDAVVLTGDTSNGFVQYTRASAGTWSNKAALADLSTVMGAKVSSLQLQAAHRDRAGKMYIFAHASAGSDKAVLRGERDGKAGSAWTFKKLPQPTNSNLYAYRAGPDGKSYVLFRNTSYPCTGACNVDTYLGTLAAGASSWSTETVHSGKWGDPNDEFLAAGALAFDKAGNLFIAAHFTRRVVTGSYKNTELLLYAKAGGAWCGESLIQKNAGFVGGDGDTFTGANPSLHVGDDGRVFILFSDQAVWHAGPGQNEMRGNPRLATGSGSSWSTTTLFGQKGQTSSAKPLYSCIQPALSVSPDGKEVLMACVEVTWQTDSIYNSSSVPATYKAMAVTATVQ